MCSYTNSGERTCIEILLKQMVPYKQRKPKVCFWICGCLMSLMWVWHSLSFPKWTFYCIFAKKITYLWCKRHFRRDESFWHAICNLLNICRSKRFWKNSGFFPQKQKQFLASKTAKFSISERYYYFKCFQQQVCFDVLRKKQEELVTSIGQEVGHYQVTSKLN